jgi:hypothetical protein
MARKVRWLNEEEMAAWGGFLTMRSKLLSHLARELQRQIGLSEADYDVLVALSEAPGDRFRLGMNSVSGWTGRRAGYPSRSVGCRRAAW